MKWKMFFSVLLCVVLLCGCGDGSTPKYTPQNGSVTDENIYNLYDFYGLFQDGSLRDSGEIFTVFGVIQEDELLSNSIVFNIGDLLGSQNEKDRVVCIFGGLDDLDGVSVNDIVIIKGELDSFASGIVTLKNCSVIAVDHKSSVTLPAKNEIASQSEFSSQQSESEQSSSSSEPPEDETSSSSSTVESPSTVESSSEEISSSAPASSQAPESSLETPSPPEPQVSSEVPDRSPVPSENSVPEEDPTLVTYVLNTSTKKFHRPDCSSAKKIKPENYGTCDSRESAIAQGYSPCKICKP